MMTDVVSNCISYMERITPGLLLVSLCIAAIVTILALGIGALSARIALALPRVLSIVIRILLFLFILMPPTLMGILVSRLLVMVWPALHRFRDTMPVLPWIREMLPGRVAISSAVGALVVSLPILLLLACAAIRRVDAETILAARTLGMQDKVILRHVILPQARPLLVPGVILTFVRALGESSATAVVLSNAPVERGLLQDLAEAIANGAYLCICLYIAGCLLAGGLLILLDHLYERHHASAHRIR